MQQVQEELETEQSKTHKLENQDDKLEAELEESQSNLQKAETSFMNLAQSAGGAGDGASEALMQKMKELNTQLDDKTEELEIMKTAAESSEQEVNYAA